jgi:hypothetical protein
MEQVEFFAGNAAIPQRLGIGNLDASADPIVPWRSWITRLFASSDEQLASYDIAELNLLCAFGLPGAEDLDIASCLKKLDYTAQLVRRNTEEWRPQFDRNPQEYNHSYAHFCMSALVTVLQRQIGVRYNLSFSEGEYNGTDSRNLFIHGLLTGYGGTCVTMPVLYIAVGRRLGYPLKLAEAKEHTFVRWDDPQGERFNIEATSQGYSPRDDEHFKTWPKPLTAYELSTGLFLKSLTPRQELAHFLMERAICLRDNLQLAASLESLYYASLLYRDDPRPRLHIVVGSVMLEIVETIKRTGQLYGVINVLPSSPEYEWKCWAIPRAERELNRILDIHRQKRAHQAAPAT